MKTLIFDIETTPLMGYAWRPWQTDLIEVVQDWQMICFAYKFLGDKQTHFIRPPVDDPWDDEEMVKILHSLFDEADVIVGHNLDKFDVKKSNALFMRHGLNPPAPFKTIDTLKVARKNFANTSNRLDSLGKLMGIGEKVETEGYMKLFKGCMHDNSTRAWRLMKKYNLQDVNLTEKLYIRLRPWIKNHPIDLENPEGCPTCGSHNVSKRGFRDTRAFRYQRYKCNDCGSWHRGRTHMGLEKPKYV